MMFLQTELFRIFKQNFEEIIQNLDYLETLMENERIRAEIESQFSEELKKLRYFGVIWEGHR